MKYIILPILAVLFAIVVTAFYAGGYILAFVFRLLWDGTITKWSWMVNCNSGNRFYQVDENSDEYRYDTSPIATFKRIIHFDFF